MAAVPGSIMLEASRARNALQELCRLVKAKTESGTVPSGVDADAKYLSDCLDRFNIWAGSLGVFQKGDASLDARLSNHILAREVLRLLRQLHAVTSDLRDIIDGRREQSTWTKSSLQFPPGEFSDASSSSEEEQDGVLTPETDPRDSGPSLDGIGGDELVTESRDLHLSVEESITSLMRLSIQVHKSSRKAKFAKSSVDRDYAIGPDVGHVRDFFPHLMATGNAHLAEKLGKANAQRRQWLWYRRRHHEKLSLDYSKAAEQDPPETGGWTECRDCDTESIAPVSANELPTPSIISGTRASTFRSRITAPSLLSPSATPLETVFGRSSMATATEQRLLVPEPPHDLVLGKPYLCRYCYNVIEISGRHAWQRHVHSDLSSYICLAEDCDEVFFESRNKWWAHELEAHRKIWTCGMCRAGLRSKADMNAHLRDMHADHVRMDHLEDVAYSFGRPASYFKASDCPMCDYPSILRSRGLSDETIVRIPADKFGRHLGRHLEQLALFVLPSADLIDEDDVSGDDQERWEDGDSDECSSDSGQQETLSEPELIQRLAEIASSRKHPERLPGSPDLAMRWQPPQDFTPPPEHFDAEDPDDLPIRQEPIFGGDLHTPGWARGTGNRREGFCARCPVSHWVNIADGSYGFHLTYFHGVPDSGVPLPRPSIIRPVLGQAHVWEAFCKACDEWKVLKKTSRGWNWYRHWLKDHAEIVKHRTEAIRNGANPDTVQLQKPRVEPSPTSEPGVMRDPKVPDQRLQRELDLLQHDLTASPLALYAARGMAGATEELLAQLIQTWSKNELHALVNTTIDTGDTLLMASAAHGLESVVRQLLDLGADPNVRVGPDQHTALDVAADAGYFSTAEQLVAGGADVSQAHLFRKILSNEREYAGENTTIHLGRQAASLPPSKIDVGSLSQLGRAAFEGDVAAAGSILGSDESGPSRCDVEEGEDAGCSPFLLASMRNHSDMMEFLLSRGANINTTSKNGWTPLMLASKRGDEDCVRWLIDHGADVNHLSPDRWTALAEATNNGFTRIMTLLLNAGADPEIRAQSDWAPLMHAAYRGDLEAVNILLDAGASFEEISARDETVMLLAAAAGSPPVVKRLLDAGCAPDSMWSTALDPGRETPGPVLVAAEADAQPKLQERIERVYKVGWTPLMVASQVGSLEIVAMLLDAGANPARKSPMFKTALEIARENGKMDVAEYLERRLGVAGS